MPPTSSRFWSQRRKNNQWPSVPLWLLTSRTCLLQDTPLFDFNCVQLRSCSSGGWELLSASLGLLVRWCALRQDAGNRSGPTRWLPAPALISSMAFVSDWLSAWRLASRCDSFPFSHSQSGFTSAWGERWPLKYRKVRSEG